MATWGQVNRPVTLPGDITARHSPFEIEQAYHSAVAEKYDFPDDLRDAQLELHQAQAEYRALCRRLPWSVEPEPGWTSEKQMLNERVVSFPASPGYTAEELARVDEFRRRILDLSVTVSTHPYWTSLTAGVVDARMALKHTGGRGDGDAAA